MVDAAELERETGLGKDLLRKWRARYGFPTPVKNAAGEYGYAKVQIAQLRLIKRLVDTGFRPNHVVGMGLDELVRLNQTLVCAEVSTPCSASTRAALELLQRHDLSGLAGLLERERDRQSLTDFIEGSVAPLMFALGEAWARGEIEVYQEHLCTALLIRQLFAEIGKLQPKASSPRIVFATPSDELHVLGLMMAHAVLAEQGAECISVGSQIPVSDLDKAARACRADIVALSFSFSYPKHRVRPLLLTLRELLPEAVEIWAGGAGAGAIKRPPMGIRIFSDLRQAANVLLARFEKTAA
jgi:methylmalonyl-CoA mutase cobalamin-binding subunit/DNA-binding transcriptional MerR regulator